MLQVPVQVIAKAGYAYEHNDQVKLVPDIAKLLHVVAKLDTYPGKEIAPDQAADEGKEIEHKEVRF